MSKATATVTRVGNFRTFSVSREINSLSDSTDAQILALVGNDKRVLELGCGSGHMSRALHESGSTVVGIEINPAAAHSASEACERVIINDLDYMDFDKELGTDRFDVVLATDVLEHLKDPLSVLQSAKRFLLPNGYIVISVPNIAHISVRLALLAGKFPYAETGLLDQTHLRFLTRTSLEKLLDDANLVIGAFVRITNIPTDPLNFEVPYDPSIVPPDLLEQISRDPEATTYQFVLSAYALPIPELRFIRDQMTNLAREADAARWEADHFRMELERAQALNDGAQADLEIARADTKTLQEEVQALQQYSVALETEKSAAAQHELELQSERDLLESEIERLQRELEQRDAQVSERDRRMAGINSQVETLLNREKDLRDMLLDAHDQLLRRDDEIALTLAAALPQATQARSTAQEPAAQSTAPPSQPAAGGKYLQYQQLIHKIRELVRSRVPQGGDVLVVSKGDDDLLRLDPCKGSHFPQREDGRYAGYYPADGVAALDHLKDVQKRGARFFLIPQTALWWLDHYRELADYLNQLCRRIIDEPDVCLMFELSTVNASAGLGRRATSTTATCPFGVNIAGNITSEKGVGEAVRAQTRSLTTVNVPIVLNNLLDETAVNVVNEFTECVEDNPYSVNLIHLNADALTDFVQSRPESYFDGRYNVGFWAWETSSFPSLWWDRFQYLDEIWVGSEFVLDTISRVSPIPVIKAPLAIPDRASLCPLSRSHFGFRKKTFVFLFVFDYMSIFQRKNPLGLVQAFRKAFKASEDVVLVLKCGHSEAYSSEARLLEQASEGLNVRIIDSLFSRQEVNSLMNAADCYVSLHRSEGFGLTLAEAMSLGKPVIATGYSGNMDFMSPANSYLIKYKVSEIAEPYGPYEQGEWAEPDVKHAAELMRFVFANRAAAKQIGKRARADILRTLNPQATGTLMRDRLLRLAQLGRIAAPSV